MASPFELVELRLDASRYLRELQALVAKPVQVKVGAVLTGAVNQAISQITQPRTVQVNVQANAASLAAVAKQVQALQDAGRIQVGGAVSQFRQLGGTATGVKTLAAAVKDARKATADLGTAADRATGFLGKAFIITGAFTVGRFAGELVKSAAAFEQTTIAFEGLLGSAGRARALLGDLREFAAITPFELPDVLDATKKLLALGTAAHEIIPTMTTLGDVAAALGAGPQQISLVVRALGQIRGKGRVLAEELNQISENFAGFSAVSAIAIARGQTVAETMDDMRAGAVDAQSGIEAILQGMRDFPGAANAMIRQSQTLNGVMSTLRDNLRNAFIDAFLPAIKQITPAIQRSFPLFEQFGANFGKFAVAIADSLIPALQGAIPLFGELSAAFAAGLRVLSPFVEGLASVDTRILAFGVGAAILVKVVGGFARALNDGSTSLGHMKIAFQAARGEGSLFEAGIVKSSIAAIQSLGRLRGAALLVGAALTSALSGAAFGRADSGLDRFTSGVGIASSALAAFVGGTAAFGPIGGAVAGLGSIALSTFTAFRASSEKARKEFRAFADTLIEEALKIRDELPRILDVEDVIDFKAVNKQITDALGPEGLKVVRNAGLTFEDLRDIIVKANGDSAVAVKLLFDEVNAATVNPAFDALVDNFDQFGAALKGVDRDRALAILRNELGLSNQEAQVAIAQYEELGGTFEKVGKVSKDVATAITDIQVALDLQRADELVDPTQRAIANFEDMVARARFASAARSRERAEEAEAQALAEKVLAAATSETSRVQAEMFAVMVDGKRRSDDFRTAARGLGEDLFGISVAAGEASGNFDDLNDEVERAISAFLELAGAPIDAAAAELAFVAGNAELAEQLKESKASLDEYTKAGRENREAIGDQLLQAQELSGAEAKAKGSIEAGTKAYALRLEAIRQSATDAGLSKEAFDALVASLDATPTDIETAFRLTITPEQLAQLETLKTILPNLDAEKQLEISAILNGDEQVQALYSAVKGLNTDEQTEIVIELINAKQLEAANKIIESLSKQDAITIRVNLETRLGDAQRFQFLLSGERAGRVFNYRSFRDGGIETIERLPGVFSTQGTGQPALAHVFAEKDLPWEAYISGAPEFRDRSVAILQRTAELLGVQLAAGAGIAQRQAQGRSVQNVRTVGQITQIVNGAGPGQARAELEAALEAILGRV